MTTPDAPGERIPHDLDVDLAGQQGAEPDGDLDGAGHGGGSRWARWRPATHAARRRWVVAFWVALAATAVAGGLPDAPILTLLAILTSLGIGIMLRWSIASTADLPDELLDERLVVERDAAYRVAYSLIATIFVVAAVAIDIGSDFTDVTPITSALLPTTPVLCLFTPSAVIAWRRTDL